MRGQQFGRKLNEAIKFIAHHQCMTMSGVVLKLAETLSISSHTLDNWRYGRRLPASGTDAATLAEALWELTRFQREHFDRAWFQEFLDLLEFPEAEAFLQAHFPQEAPASDPTPIPPPPPETAPTTAHFVGRSSESVRAQALLQTQHYLLLTGMAGQGKTTFAAHLVSTPPFADRPVFWHTLRPDEDPETVLWRLAAFLAHLGDPVIWRILQKPQHPPQNILLSALLERLSREQVILCFDDYHLVDQEAFHIHLIEPILHSVGDTLKLILISRHLPRHLPVSEIITLSGLDKHAAAQLVALHGISLAPSEFERLYRTAQGNPQLLLLAAAVLKQGQDISAPDTLWSSDAIMRYLLLAVYQGLSEDEREVLRVIALLDEEIASREAIEGVMQAGSRLSILLSLQEKHLLAVRDTAQGKRYGMHQAVRAFFVELMSARERQHLLLQIARHFVEQHQALPAAYYYAQAGNLEQAIAWLPEQPEVYLGQGKAPWLGKLVAAFQQQPQTPLSPEAHLRLMKIQGALLRFQGRYRDAIALFASLLRQEDLPQAWKANMAFELALTYERMRDMPQARAHYQLALEAYQREGNESGVGKSLRGLGWVAMRAGESKQAVAYLRQALAIAEKRGDPVDIAKAKFGLGSALIAIETLAEAQVLLEESRTTFEAVGDRWALGMAVGNLGLVAGLQGDRETQRQRYEEAMAILEPVGELKELQVGHHNMIYLYLALGDHTRAQEHARTLHELARLSEEPRDLCTAYAGLAMVSMAMGRLDEAADYAEQAYGLADNLPPSIAKGAALRAMGALQFRLGNQGRGTELLKQSAEMFAALAAWDEYDMTSKLQREVSLLFAQMQIHKIENEH